MAKPPDPVQTADEKKLEQARVFASKAKALAAAAEALVEGWAATGFYDRQDPAAALDLHSALNLFKEGKS